MPVAKPSELAVTLTVAQLAELVEDAVRKASGSGGPSDVMTREQVAGLLGLHPNVVGKMVKTRGLPAHRIGNGLRFLRSEVLAWLQSGKGAEVTPRKRKGAEAA